MPSHDPDYDELRAKYTSLQNSAKTPGLHALLNSHLTISTEDTIDALFKCLTAAYHDLRATTIRQQQPDPDPAELNAQWARLSGDIIVVAECLWIGSLVNNRRTARKRLPLLAVTKKAVQRSHQLMIVWLEASLYVIRTENNSDASELQAPAAARQSPTRVGIRALFEGEKPQPASEDASPAAWGYVRTIKTWDRTLRIFTGHSPFKDGTSIVQQLKGMVHEFGPNSLNVNDEGWAAQAADAAAELRFQLREAIRRERWHAKNLPFALWSETFKVTAGYGTRLGNFFWTAAIFVVALAVTYFVNDLLNPGLQAVRNGALFCPEAHVTVNWHGWFPTCVTIARYVIRYLYFAVTNLTSLGSDPRLATYCGGLSTQIIVIISVVMGYFLLTLLASLLFNRLKEAD